MSKNILLILIALCLVLSLKHAFSANSAKEDRAKLTGKSDPKKVFSKDEYELYKSVYLGRNSKVEKLVKSGVNINVHSPNSKRTPLHLAASRGKADIAKILVENGANLEIKNADGKTALHIAIDSSKAEVIKYLHSKGAKITQDMINAASAKIKQVLTSLK